MDLFASGKVSTEPDNFKALCISEYARLRDVETVMRMNGNQSDIVDVVVKMEQTNSELIVEIRRKEIEIQSPLEKESLSNAAKQLEQAFSKLKKV